MPRIGSSKQEIPPVLKPYISLGLDLNWKGSDKEAIGQCPFCSAEDKFSVKVLKDQWKCFVCNEGSKKGGGNIYTFMNGLLTHSQENTSDEDFKKLADERRILNIEHLKKWNLAKSYLTNEWILPSYNVNYQKEIALVQLYRYSKQLDKFRLLATSELKHGLFGVNLYRPSCKVIYLTEGPWCGIVLRETLAQAKMLSGTSVLSSPGCNVFNSGWNYLFEGKEVIICFDNDYPKVNKKTKQKIAPPGFSGVKRTAAILASSSKPPKTIKYLYWGEEGFTKKFKNGMDVRDYLCQK